MSSPVIMTAEELRRVNYPDKCTELVRGRLVVREPASRSSVSPTRCERQKMNVSRLRIKMAHPHASNP